MFKLIIILYVLAIGAKSAGSINTNIINWYTAIILQYECSFASIQHTYFFLVKILLLCNVTVM